MSPDLRGSAAMARRIQLASLLLLGCVSLALAADKVAELSDDFLEYLGSLEGNDESWMDFAESAGKEPARPQAQADNKGKVNDKPGDSKVVASASSSASSPASAGAQSMPHAASMNTSAASKTGKVER